MAYKNISLSVEAYEKLVKNKKKSESFSEEIERLIGKPSLEEVAGILTEEEAQALEEGVKEVRKSFTVRTWQ